MKKDVKTTLIWAAVILVFCAGAALWPVISPVTGNEMGYCVLLYYIVFPLLAFSGGIIAGGAALPRGLFLGAGCVALTAVLGMLMPLPVFGSVWPEVAAIGAALAAVGFIFRRLVRLAVTRRGNGE